MDKWIIRFDIKIVEKKRHDGYLLTLSLFKFQQIEFIRKHIPSDVKIYLVGHSIGAYCALKLLQVDDIASRIQHCYFLFPTVEYMVSSVWNSAKIPTSSSVDKQFVFFSYHYM